MFYKDAVVVAFVIVVILGRSAESQTSVPECSDYINRINGNAPRADKVKVKNGARLTFICRDCGCDSPSCWSVDERPIYERNLHQAPNFYNIADIRVPNGCINKLSMTAIISSGTPYHNTIECKRHNSDCCTNEICSRNVTANYILVEIEEENNLTSPPCNAMSCSVCLRTHCPSCPSSHCRPKICLNTSENDCTESDNGTQNTISDSGSLKKNDCTNSYVLHTLLITIGILTTVLVH